MFDQYENKYARWIRVLAPLVMVAGILTGLIIWFQDVEDLFVPFLSAAGYSIVSGILLYGFAEIIEILYRIYQRLESVDGIKRLLEKIHKPE